MFYKNDTCNQQIIVVYYGWIYPNITKKEVLYEKNNNTIDVTLLIFSFV